jgi:hypothetical protein
VRTFALAPALALALLLAGCSRSPEPAEISVRDFQAPATAEPGAPFPVSFTLRNPTDRAQPLVVALGERFLDGFAEHGDRRVVVEARSDLPIEFADCLDKAGEVVRLTVLVTEDVATGGAVLIGPPDAPTASVQMGAQAAACARWGAQ